MHATTPDTHDEVEAEVFGFRIKSDNLRKLRPLVDWAADQLGGVERLPRLYLIIDANTIRRELGFRVRRRKSAARTDLDEILESGIATVFAPPFLVEEVEKHLEKWAQQMKVPAARLRAEWEQYRQGIVFCQDVPARGEPARRMAERDPQDLPYVYLQANLSAEAVLTLDKDIKETGTPTADTAIVADLREYARHQSVFVTIATSGVAGIVVVLNVLLALGRLLVHSVVGIILSLAAGTLLWLLHRKEKARVGSSAFTRAWNLFKECVKKLLGMMERSRSRARIRWKRITTVFAGVRRRTLRQFIFAVCLMARKALTIIEIIRRVLSEGHRTRARQFRYQVRRCLKGDRRFLETTAGWVLKGWAAAAGPGSGNAGAHSERPG